VDAAFVPRHDQFGDESPNGPLAPLRKSENAPARLALAKFVTVE